jgi:hypothetical protein
MVLILTLSACTTTVPITQRFPEAPNTLFEKCKQLELVQQDSSIIDATKVVVNNYTQYYQCSTQVDGWIEWYKTQQKIFKELE